MLMSDDKIKVSVIVITFDQQEYIGQCLDSVLSQNVDFEIEIIVGDDASSDSTPAILKEYRSRYPDIITLVLREENIGGSANALDLLCRAKGEYIAFIEGDDLWSDKNKLRLQCDFLDGNPQFVGCYHDVALIDENNAPVRGKLYWLIRKKSFGYHDFDGIRIPGHSSSWLRRNLIAENKETYARFLGVNPDIADRTSALFFLSYGDFARIDGRMSCYRYNRKKGVTAKTYKSPVEALKVEIDFIYALSALSEALGKPLEFRRRKNYLFLRSLYTALRYRSREARQFAGRLFRDCKCKPLMILSLVPEAFCGIYRSVFYLE